MADIDNGETEHCPNEIGLSSKRCSQRENALMTEKIRIGEKRFLVTCREYNLCDECKFFPPETDSGWKKSPPRCKLRQPMRFMEPETVGDAVYGDCGFIPLCFTCEEFEKNGQD